MANFPYPYDPLTIDQRDDAAPLDSSLYKELPPEFQEAAGRDLHLLKYLLKLPVNDLGMPTYQRELERSDGDAESPNIIYPIGNGLYAHILGDANKGRDHYISIEPAIEHPDLDEINHDVEERLLDFTEDLERAQDEESLRKVLGHTLDIIFGRTVGALVLDDEDREEDPDGEHGEQAVGEGGG